MGDYKITVGVECHVQLNTKTKLFSGVDNDAVDKEPNSCVSPVDYALPGMLPVLNKAAAEKAVKAGLAMNCKINLTSRFDRKHYYYPDLPKGYQITQMYMPIIGAGVVHLPDGSDVHIEHAHLEEDAGKLSHFGAYSLVDLNRAGTPLIEIVSMPDMHSAAQVRSYCEELHRLMLYAGVTNGDLYQGNMRFDVNVSVSKTEELGTRTETKNLNSFRSIERAVEYEVKRQIALLEKGEKVKQETRGWNDTTGKTTSQRSKEEREAILNYPILAKRLAEAVKKNASLSARIAHWFSGVLLAEENQDKNFSLATADELIELSDMVEKKELSSTGAKAVLMEMYDKKNTAKTPHTLAKEMNLLQENDTEALSAIIDEVLAMPECAKAADDVRNGEMKAIGFLVGQVMKKSKGKANPASVNELIKQKLA